MTLSGSTRFAVIEASAQRVGVYPQLEGFAPIDRHDRNLVTVLLSQVGIRVDVERRQLERTLAAHLIQYGFCYIA